MPFCELVDLYLNKEIAPQVQELLRLKKNTPEIGTSKRIDIINDYIKSSIAEIETIIATYPTEGCKGWDELNAIFLDVLI
jgi:predicted nucleotidyltransferase